MGKGRFSHFEARLERLIEGSFARLFGGPLHPRDVALQLARAIEAHTRTDEESREVAPNFYRVRLHPDDHTTLLKHTTGLEKQLAQHVAAVCVDAGLYLPYHPQVILIADTSVAAHTLHVEAVHTAYDATKTAILDRAVSSPRPMGIEAQLIINGTRTVSLNREVFNIGRRPDNNLVLDDIAVSRHHLQIRLRHGRYVLYDAESQGGTYVNGQLVKEHLLAPGDLIQIGQTSLLYLEEEATEALGDTQLDLMPPDLPP